MVAQASNLIKQTTTSTGTGNLTLATLLGFQSFDVAFGHGATTNVFYYFLRDATNGAWEYGTGHMASSTVLVRDTVIGSTNSNSAVDFLGGTLNVVCDLPAEFQMNNTAPNTLILQSYTNTIPPIPSDGVTAFARKRAGVEKLTTINSTDPWNEVQYALYRGSKSFVQARGLGNTGIGGFGILFDSATNNGGSPADFATTNFLTKIMRSNQNTTASAGTSGYRGTNSGDGIVFRGDTAGTGGFFIAIRFGIETHQTGQRIFVGIVPAADIGNNNPSSVNNVTGVGMDDGDTNLSFISVDNSGNATKTALGSSFPGLTDGATYEVRLYAAPNDTKIYYSLERLDVSAFVEGSESTNLFLNTTPQNITTFINNGATAAIAKLAFISAYFETNY